MDTLVAEKNKFSLYTVLSDNPEDPTEYEEIPVSEEDENLPMLMFLFFDHGRPSHASKWADHPKFTYGYEDFLNEEYRNKESHWIIIPVYVYKHSGIVFSFAPFNDRFDSGTFGYVVVHKQLCQKMGIEKTTPEELAKSIAKPYLSYLAGDVYDYKIVDTITGEDVSYLGTYYSEKEAEEAGREELEIVIKNAKPETFRQKVSIVFQLIEIGKDSTIVDIMIKAYGNIEELVTQINDRVDDYPFGESVLNPSEFENYIGYLKDQLIDNLFSKTKATNFTITLKDLGLAINILNLTI